VRGVAKGLAWPWYVYRGANVVTFDPPQFKVWKDQRGGSPWAPTWVNPTIPTATSGLFVRRSASRHLRPAVSGPSDGLWNTNENVTFVVTP